MNNYKTIIENILNEAGVTIGGDSAYDLVIKDPKWFKEVWQGRSLALGESYMANWWECQQLDEFFFKLLRYVANTLSNKKFAFFLMYLKNLLFNFQTQRRSKIVAKQHYDLGNDLYEAMLGKSMAYSCGYWKTADNLDMAQYAKYDLICKKLNLQPGESILDIGCGWGTFAEFAAARYGVKATGISLSQRQIEWAKANNKNSDVSFYLADYRNIASYNPRSIKYDKIISIGMFEHVGYANYKHFLKIARQNLKEDGLFLLHTIGCDRAVSFAVDNWLQKYIFPNSILPTLKQLSQRVEGVFVLEDWHNFGVYYDKTLMAWYDNFKAQWPNLKDNYDDSFYRMWEYYLLSCAGAFRARYIQLWQLVLSPHGQLNGYTSIR